MFHMKRKTLALFAGGVGALGLLAMAEKYRQSRAEMKKAALIQDIRQEDGRAYSFVYAEDILTYEEEQA